MNKEPLVSVCVQTYQHASFIRECLDGILMQKTNFPFELILGEDESTDGTREICMEYAEKYPHIIRLFLRSRKDVIYINGSPTGRFNMVENLKAASGKYIALCEGDDYWTDPLKLQKQVDFLEANPDCVSCHHWHQYAFPQQEGGYKIIPAPTKNQGYLPFEKASVKEIFANKLRVKTRTHMFRNVIKEYPGWFYKVAFGDVPLTMLLGKYGEFGFINEPMAVYRQTGQGVSSHGKTNYWFKYTHFLSWVKIWEIGLIHYHYQFKNEAIETINSFYLAILSHYHHSLPVFSKLLGFAVFKSKLSYSLRLKIFFAIAKSYRTYSIKIFVKRKLLQVVGRTL